jgi:hypothetical protein
MDLTKLGFLVVAGEVCALVAHVDGVPAGSSKDEAVDGERRVVDLSRA